MKASDPITPRMDGESPKAYAAFLSYRNLGLNRSLEQARFDVGDGSARCLRVLEEWSARWNWVDRSREWDNHVQGLTDRAWARAAARAAAKEAKKWELRREQALEGNWQTSAKILALVNAMLDTPIVEEEVEEDTETGKVVKIYKPGRWSFRDLAALARTGVDIQSVMLAAATKSLEGLSEAELSAVAGLPEEGDEADEAARGAAEGVTEAWGAARAEPGRAAGNEPAGDEAPRDRPTTDPAP